MLHDARGDLVDVRRELFGEEGVEHFVQVRDERVQLGGRATEVLVAKLADDAFVEVLGAREDFVRLVLERLQLEQQVLLEAREDAEQRLLGEAHGLQLAVRAADLFVQLALEEEAREALAGDGELALEDGGELPLAEEAMQVRLERLRELGFEVLGIGRRRDAPFARDLLLEQAQLAHDLRGDGVELGVGREVGAVQGDLGLHLLVAQNEGELGERELLALGHEAFVGRHRRADRREVGLVGRERGRGARDVGGGAGLRAGGGGGEGRGARGGGRGRGGRDEASGRRDRGGDEASRGRGLVRGGRRAFFAGARALAVELAGALDGGARVRRGRGGDLGHAAGKLGLGGRGPRGGKGGGTRFIGSEWSVSRGGARREVRSRTAGAPPRSERKEEAERSASGTRAREEEREARATRAAGRKRKEGARSARARVRLTPAEPRVVCADLRHLSGAGVSRGGAAW